MSLPLFAQFEFIENKGQWHENVQYKIKLNNGAIFFENNCITYNFFNDADMQYSVAHHQNEWENFDLVKHFHAFKAHFRNSNNNPKIVSSIITEDYENYFIGNNPLKWASNVRKFGEIKYENIYNGIDLKYYNDDNGLKYDFIVEPGADPSKIQIEFEGLDNLYLEHGNLKLFTSVNTITEIKPYAYQIIKGTKKEVKCNYVLRRNRLSFEFPDSWDKTKELIIDPSLVFSTYTGSTGDNWGFTATWDYNDNVYSGGIVFAVGYPTSTGAYQINFAGGTYPNPQNPNWYPNGCDIGIIKYNETGTQRLFATYLGGTTGQEMPHSLVVTEDNDLIIMGTTGSSDFPVSSNAFRTYFLGGDSLVYDNVIAFPYGVDIFVAKISENGNQLLGGTYVGGSSNDGLNFRIHYTHPDPITNINWVKQHGNDSLYANYGDGARGEVIVDSKNFVYVGTTTFSTNFSQGIYPGFQPNNNGGQEGIVFKMSPDLSQMIWSSYIGGTGDDAVFSVALNDNYDVLVAGATVSHNFPTTPGAYNTTHNGGSTDAFVSKISTNGNTLLSSTFFGSNRFDNAFFVRTDRFDNVFICGQTKATGNTLIQNAGYSIPNSGQFITKFNPNLTNVVWSTVFGTGNGKPNISITAFAVDVCDRIYLAGWGRDWPFMYYNANSQYYTWDDTFGTKGMQVTADAIQSQTDGMDFYVLVLSDDASQLEYASFFGELRYPSCSASGRDHVDGGTSRFDNKGHIIQSVCASCGGCQQFPTNPNPGAWSNTNNSTNCNNAVFKIRIIENLAAANFDPVPAGCVPYTVQFNNNSQGNVVSWNFGDGSPPSTATNPTHTYTSGGDFTVTLVVNDPLSCNINDTLSRIITVIEPGSTVLAPETICPGQNVIIGPETNYPAGTSFQWIPPTNLSSSSIKNPVANPSQTTEYLLIASGICIDSIWQTVNMYEPDIDIFVTNDTIICPGESLNITAWTNSQVDSWQWSNNSNFSNILSTTQNLIVSPNATTTYYVRARENICNTFVVEQVTVSVHQFNYVVTPNHIICEGGNVNLTVTNYNPQDQLSYVWSPAAHIISGANTNSPLVAPPNNTTFYVTITNQYGCTSSAQVSVEINDLAFASPQLTHNLCYDDCNGSANISANGISPYQYNWNTGQTGATQNNLCAGTYTVTVTDFIGCTAVTSLTITQAPELLINFTNVHEPECDGIGFGSASINAIGGTPSYSYNWSYGGTQQNNNTLLVGMNYITVTDSNNCQTLDSIYMPPPGTLISVVEDFNMVSCYGYCDGNINVLAQFGLEPYSYFWSNGMNTSAISNLCPGQYIVTIIDAENCVTHQQMWIHQPDSLIATATQLMPIPCFNETGTVGVNVSGGNYPYQFNWSTGDNSNSISGLSSGIYQVTVTDSRSCQDVSEIYLSQPPELLADTAYNDMICSNVCNGSIRIFPFGGTPPYNYNWSDDLQTGNVNSLCEGDYYLTLTDNNGCSITKNFTINNLNYIPPVSADADKYIIFMGESSNLTASAPNSSSFIWTPSNSLNNNNLQNPVASPYETTLYTVRVIDSMGCSNIDTVRIFVKEILCGEPYIFVPNAFTPNGDGINDEFMVKFPIGMLTELYFAVFNRWGEVLFETDNLYSNGWDGSYKGAKLSTDVFVYMMKARCLDGQIYEKKGNVTLLR